MTDADALTKILVKIAELEIQAKADREHAATTMGSQSEAEKLRAHELARRLEILNHEADRLRTMQATYVPRETYEAHMKTITGILITIGVGLLFMLLNYIFRKG